MSTPDNTVKSNYLSTVSGGRKRLYCPLVWVEPPLHCRRPHTGCGQHHSCSLQETQSSCSFYCCPPSLWCSCGCCQSRASTPAESYRPSCRVWPLTDSRHLKRKRQRDREWWMCLMGFIIPNFGGYLMCILLKIHWSHFKDNLASITFWRQILCFLLHYFYLYLFYLSFFCFVF